jgi:hypothetical protein
MFIGKMPNAIKTTSLVSNFNFLKGFKILSTMDKLKLIFLIVYILDRF